MDMLKRLYPVNLCLEILQVWTRCLRVTNKNNQISSFIFLLKIMLFVRTTVGKRCKGLNINKHVYNLSIYL